MCVFIVFLWVDRSYSQDQVVHAADRSHFIITFRFSLGLFFVEEANCCEETFSIRYPAIELLTAILFFWIMDDLLAHRGNHWNAICGFLDLRNIH